MLAPDVRFEGWTATDWTRLLSLFASTAQPTPDVPQGGVVAVHDRGRLRKLLHTRAGRLELAGEAWPVSLEALAHKHRAAWAVGLRLGALEDLMEGFGARTSRGDDVALQLLSLAQVLRDLQASGGIEMWPRRLVVPPMSAHTVLTQTLRRVCPDDHALVFGLFDRGELWTGIVVRRRAMGIDLLLGPDAFRSSMGLLSGDWRRDYRHLAAAVARKTGPVALGVFAERATLRTLLAESSPGAWARAAAVRDVILSPVSGAVALPLLFDALRGIFGVAQEVAARFDPTGVLAALQHEIGDGKGLRHALRLLLGRAPHDDDFD